MVGEAAAERRSGSGRSGQASRAAGRAALVALVATLVAASLWLPAGLPLVALADFVHDDALYVKLGGHLARAEWLGPYDESTLAKGPGFPFFVALAYRAHLPLLLAGRAALRGRERPLRPRAASAVSPARRAAPSLCRAPLQPGRRDAGGERDRLPLPHAPGAGRGWGALPVVPGFALAGGCLVGSLRPRSRRALADARRGSLDRAGRRVAPGGDDPPHRDHARREPPARRSRLPRGFPARSSESASWRWRS